MSMVVGQRVKFGAVVLAFQLVFLVLFGIFVEYDTSADARHPSNSRDTDKGGADHDNNMLKAYYPMFQDVHVMMFIGFGFLMTFLRRYGFSSVGINMLVAAFVLEWALLMGGFMHMHHGKIQLNIVSLLTADFAAAAVLISFGALLGKTSPLQMLLIAFIEIIVFTVNEYIGLEIFKVADVGGSMFVHVFGAYFGLACARVLYSKDPEETKNEGSNYHSDIFAMIGTIFLWLYWPSFNSALAAGDDQQRAVINTYIALASCCVVTFAVSALINKEGKFDMVHIQNATLAGGVAVGTTADMMIHPVGAMAIGSLAAVLSTVGYAFVTPCLTKKLKLHDTCGVHNLHGMPGLFAGIAGAVVSALASEAEYGYGMYQIFPVRAPMVNSTELADIQAVFSLVEAGEGRSASMQGVYQFVALATTFVMASVFGALTGLLMKLPIFDRPRGSVRPIMDDDLWWETPEDFNQPPSQHNKLLSDMRDTNI